MKEIDSSVLISYLAQKSKSDNVIISIKQIRELGHEIEERHPSIIVDMGKYSIESFCLKSKGCVMVQNQEIHFDRTNKDVQVLLMNNQPDNILTDLLDEIIKEED